MIQEGIRKLVERIDLSRSEVAEIMTEIADEKATAAQVGAFLALLRVKGETVDELLGAAEVVRARVAKVEADENCLDTCGTGGDGQNTFNISTGAAIVAAGAGAVVAKHGNRSVSSRCGSADVLSALGVNVEAPKPVLERCLRELGLAFLFAPKHHPAFKAVAVVRRELGVRTVFNLLGPMANPAGARRQLMGVFEPRWVPVVGQVLARLGARHALVVHGSGLDEISLTGETLVCEVRDGALREFRLHPEDLGLSRCAPGALAGGDAQQNATILREVLEGKPGAPRDAVVLNAGAALVAAGKARELTEGIELAVESIDRGHAADKLGRLCKLSQEIA